MSYKQNRNVMSQQENKIIEEANKKISEYIDKIYGRCYELYGEEHSDEECKKIIVEKQDSHIFDPELKNLIKELRYYEKLEEENNPFSQLLNMQ